MKTLIITFVILFATLNIYGQSTFYQCFDSDKNPKLKISVKYVNNIAVSVKYLGQSKAVPLVYVGEIDQGNQSELAHPTNVEKYNEKYNGKITGSYIFTQSGIWTDIEYKRKSDNKIFNFTINLEKSVINNSEYRTKPCY